MTNIDNQDDLVKRLGKLVPIYVIALLSAVAAFLDIFYSIDPLQAQIALIILIGVGVALTFYVEMQIRSVDNLLQVVIAALNGGLWLFLVNMKFFDFMFLVDLWIKFIIALWTFLIGIFYKKE